LATAEYTDTIVQVNATAAELIDEGFTQVGSSPYISYPDPNCAALGCMTLAGTSGPLPLKGFLEFQFQDFTYNPTYYNGLWMILNISYGSSGLTSGMLIDMINDETPETEVTAYTTDDADNALGTCPFSSWLDPAALNSICLNWVPDTPPGAPLSDVYRFAWNLQDLDFFNGGGISLDGAYGVPAPGALGLMAMAGLAPTRRRRG
jgi:MYXO-CTERM domain-containing protein